MGEGLGWWWWALQEEALVGPSPRVEGQGPQRKGSRAVGIVGAGSEAFCPTHRSPTRQPLEKTPSVSWS